MKDKIITEAIAFILICCYIDDVSINNWVPLIYIPPNIMRKKTTNNNNSFIFLKFDTNVLSDKRHFPHLSRMELIFHNS